MPVRAAPSGSAKAQGFNCTQDILISMRCLLCAVSFTPGSGLWTRLCAQMSHCENEKYASQVMAWMAHSGCMEADALIQR